MLLTLSPELGEQSEGTENHFISMLVNNSMCLGIFLLRQVQILNESCSGHNLFPKLIGKRAPCPNTS